MAKSYPIIRIAAISRRTRACVISGRVLAQRFRSASIRSIAFVDVDALGFAVTLKAGKTLADVVSRQVATFGVLDAFCCQLGYLAFVDVCARERNTSQESGSRKVEASFYSLILTGRRPSLCAWGRPAAVKIFISGH